MRIIGIVLYKKNERTTFKQTFPYAVFFFFSLCCILLLPYLHCTVNKEKSKLNLRIVIIILYTPPPPCKLAFATSSKLQKGVSGLYNLFSAMMATSLARRIF